MKRKIRYENIVMNVYSSVDEVIKQFDKKIMRKAVSSFSSKNDAVLEAQEIISCIDKR